MELQGSKTPEEFNKLQEYLETIPFYYLLSGKEFYEKTARLKLICRRSGVTIRLTPYCEFAHCPNGDRKRFISSL